MQYLQGGYLINKMAMNLSNINSTPLELNLSLFTDTNMISNVAANSNTVTDGLYGVFVLMIFYIFIVYELNKETGLFRLDLIKSSAFSSGIVFVIGSVMLIAELIFALYSVVWFGLVLLISLYFAHNQKEKGL